MIVLLAVLVTAAAKWPHATGAGASASSARAQPPTSVSSVTHRTVVWMGIDLPLSQPRCIGRGYFGGATANIATSGHCEAPERAASEARHDRAPCWQGRNQHVIPP